MKSANPPYWLNVIKHLLPQRLVKDTGGEHNGWYYSRLRLFGITVWEARHLCGSFVDGFGWLIVERLPFALSKFI